MEATAPRRDRNPPPDNLRVEALATSAARLTPRKEETTELARDAAAPNCSTPSTFTPSRMNRSLSATFIYMPRVGGSPPILAGHLPFLGYALEFGHLGR